MSTAKYSIGQKVKVIACLYDHGYKIGEIYEIGWAQAGASYGDGWYYRLKNVKGRKNLLASYIYTEELDVAVVSKEELLKQREDLQREIDNIDSRLAYIELSGGGEFDDTEFKVYQSLKVLENTNDPVEKAKAIAKIVSGK